DIAADNRDIRRWLRCGNRIIPTSSDLLRNETAVMHERAVLVHGNFWPDDILVERGSEGERISGIVGWSTGAAGSPVLDLAALSVHMQGWSAPLTESIVQTYSEIAPLAPEQRRLVPVVASLDLVARVAWLLRLNYVDDRMIGHPAMPVIRSGMKTLLNSLETLTHILAPDIEETHRHQRGRGSYRGHIRRPGPGGGRPSSPRGRRKPR
ncbi:MAG TPA: phosphotransferase, partial [Thermomicrobiales bacterium]|nr:phosphotransferase [Thermomicrobiales bacterium]